MKTTWLFLFSFLFITQGLAQDAYADKLKKAFKLYKKANSDYKEYEDKYFYTSSPDAPVFFITNQDRIDNFQPEKYSASEWESKISSNEVALDWFTLDNYQMDLNILFAVPLYYICEANKYDVESGNIYLRGEYELDNGETVSALYEEIEAKYPFTSQRAIISLLSAGNKSTTRSEVSMTEKMQDDTEHEITLRLWIEDTEKKKVLMELGERSYTVQTPKNRFDFTKNVAFTRHRLARYWSNTPNYTKCQNIGEKILLREVKDADWVASNLPGFQKYHGSFFYVAKKRTILAVLYESSKGTLEYHELFFNFKPGKDYAGMLKKMDYSQVYKQIDFSYKYADQEEQWERLGCYPINHWRMIKTLYNSNLMTLRSPYNRTVKNSSVKHLRKYSYDGKHIPVQ